MDTFRRAFRVLCYGAYGSPNLTTYCSNAPRYARDMLSNSIFKLYMIFMSKNCALNNPLYLRQARST